MLGALAVVVLATNLFGGSANQVAGPDASGAPTASPTAAQPTASPTAAQPTASAIPNPTPESTPEATLEPDTIAVATVNQLNVRAEPRSSSKSFGHLSVGARVFVVQGPIEAEGYGWYRVGIVDGFTSTCITNCRAAQIGWVAGISDRQEGWLVPAKPTCPPDPDHGVFAALQPLERLACYGDQTLTLNGVVWQPCCAYEYPQISEPGWLSGPTFYYLGTAGLPAHTGASFGLRFNPTAGLAVPKYADIVRVTGHMDDHAAQTCTIRIDEFALQNDPTLTVDPEMLAYAPIGCRTEFVVDAIDILGNTGEECGC